MAPTTRERKQEIQAELRRRGYSQKQVAELAGVSEATLSQVLSGTYSVATDRGRAKRDEVLAVVDSLLAQPLPAPIPVAS